MDEQYGVIYKTKEYDKFKNIKGNRRLNARNYVKLMRSMTEEQLVIPIITNDNYEIIDGQHRFNAISELGLDLYYFVVPGYGIDQVKRANLVSSNWTKEDYLNMYVEDENQHYIDFKTLKDECRMNISDLVKLFAMVQQKSPAQVAYEFEGGMFISEGMYQVRIFLEDLEMFNFYKAYKTQSFVSAFLKLYSNSNYKNDRMIEKLKTRKNALEQMNGGTIDEYLSCICNKIYSFGPGKDNIFYDVHTRRFYN